MSAPGVGFRAFLPKRYKGMLPRWYTSDGCVQLGKILIWMCTSALTGIWLCTFFVRCVHFWSAVYTPKAMCIPEFRCVQKSQMCISSGGS